MPDAKAFTDAPPDVITLMKQRRRWMNGAFFGTKKVIVNVINMVSCKRTNHGCIKKSFMVLFMIYTGALYTLQFFIVGAMFASIYAFFDELFAVSVEGNEFLEKEFENGTFSLVFAYVYIFLIIMALIMSLAMPPERIKVWFRVLVGAFGLVTIVCITGVIFFLINQTFYPPEKHYITDEKRWEDTGNYYFSWLVLAGVIMFSIYAIPIIMRPIDFLQNIPGYLVGLFTYIFLIPMFINVFSIYAFSNLHDVSWGNRPTSSGTGTEAFSSDRAVQMMTEHNYAEFRANLLFIWLCCNGAYFFVVLKLSGSSNPTY